MRVVRINTLTQCIIFITFMNFLVRTAVLCVLCALCGEKWLFSVVLLVLHKAVQIVQNV